MPSFAPEVVTAVLAHMNTDHRDDNLVIAQAFGEPNAESARMTGLDGAAGTWAVTVDGAEKPLRVPWSHEITERPQIRQEVVALYREACDRLGREFRQH